jgi:O-antigen/teichoic acid export membrane protein
VIDVQKIRVVVLLRVEEIWRSRVARQGVIIAVILVGSKVLNFFASAYSARCLGAVNFGVSGLIFGLAMQAGMLCHGGFDAVVVRRIAADKTTCKELMSVVVGFRVLLFLPIAVLWMGLTFWLVAPEEWVIWQLGLGVMVFNTVLNMTFAYQGLEKLPTLNVIAALGTVITMVGYFSFTPRMPLGSDLLVVMVAGVVTTGGYLVGYRHYVGEFPFRFFRIEVLTSRLRLGVWIGRMRELVGESWRYWVVMVGVLLGTVFQIPLVSWLGSEREAGIFRSGFMLGTGLDIAYSSFHYLLLPRFVVWLSEGGEVFLRQRKKVLWLFIGMGLLVSGGSIIFSDWIYQRFYGEEFLTGSTTFQLIAVAKGINFVGQIYASTLVAYKRDSGYAWTMIGGSGLSVTLSIGLIPIYGIAGAAVSMVVAEAVMGGLFWIQTRNTGEK